LRFGLCSAWYVLILSFSLGWRLRIDNEFYDLAKIIAFWEIHCLTAERDLVRALPKPAQINLFCRYVMPVARKANSCLLALLALASGLLYAQEFSFRSFGTADGLNNLAVRRIFQDRVGFLWVSTENGIFRYDGDRFEPFGVAQGVPSNSGAAFGDAPDGSLLIGGDFGLYRLTGNRFEKVPTAFKTINWAQGIQADGKGHTFLGTDAGLVEVDSESGQVWLELRTLPKVQGTSGPEAYAVLVDGESVWYGCGNELCRMSPKETRVFGRESGLPDRPLLSILKDRAGNMWVRARNAGVFERPAGKARFQRPALPVPSENLGGVPTIDSDGRILLTTPDGLLIGDGKSWEKIGASAGLRGAVYAAFEDRQHSLWIGLAGRGLAQWRGYREWESFSTASGLASDLVYEILPRPDGSLWGATEAGLFRGERQQFGMVFKPVAGLTGFAVHSLRLAPDGDVWIGTETLGAARIHAKTGKVEWFGPKQGLTGRAAYTLRFDREQRLWAATEAGLFEASAPYRKFSRIAELPTKRIWAVAEGTDGTMWAGGTDGLFELAAGHWKNLTLTQSLSNKEVLSLGAGPNGAMWVGYRFGGGIDRVHPAPGGVTIEKGVQRPGSDGLIYFLNFDSRGRLWVGTERGVDMWDGSRWSHYDVSDGLTWDDCNLNAFVEDLDGAVWIGTAAGLSRFKPRLSRSPDTPLEVVFTKLAVGQTDVSGLRTPSFGSYANSLVARYSALNAPRENGVVFRYRLVGANSGWTETSQRELQFANLASGSYRLEIEAQESDGAWSGRRAEFPFNILPPWYWSWWFISLCVLIPLMIAAGVLRLRMLGAQRRERELVQLVKEKTTDLRQANEKLQEKTTDLQQANEKLQKLSFTDPLTGLANRRIFDQTLDKECARLGRSGASLSLISIDADHFKALNDSQGHQRGDEYLMLLAAELIKVARRQIDVAARCGGEEFALVLPETSSSDAERVAETVRVAIANLMLPHPASAVVPFLTVSVGVATATYGCWSTPEELVARADMAMYEAKRAGRNRVCVAQRAAGAEEAARSSLLDLH
jgi:diguanylate cyclase (GGDEF)-like protein